MSKTKTDIGGGWSVCINEFRDIHIVPQGEEHLCGQECQCRPTPGRTGAVWLHHSFDRREYTRERQ